MFITIEGVDGCGKTTIAREIVRRLKKDGLKVYLTFEPTDTWLGDAVRRGINEMVSGVTEAFLFMSDRAEHTEKIKKKLSQGYIVISDRYSDSTCAYQSVSIRDSIPDALAWLMNIHRAFTLKPDITFLLIAPVDICLNRIKKREEKKIKFERRKFLIDVEKNYKKIAEREKRVIVLNADRRPEEIVSEAIKIIKQKL